MLQKLRDHSRGWLAMGLLGLLVIAFAIWGIDSPFNTRTVLAEVNGEEIPPNLILNAYRTQLNSYQSVYPNGIPPLQLERIKKDVLDGFVADRVLNQFTQSAGFRVSDQALAEYISALPEFQIDGDFSIDLFKQRAAQTGMDARSFENQIRLALRKLQIRNGLVETSFATPTELAKRGALESETRTIDYFVLPAAKYVADVTPDESLIRNEYDANIDRYMTQESVKLDYIELSRDALADDVAIDEAEIRSHYDDAVASEFSVYRKDETRQGRHILIAVADEAGDEAAKTEAQSLLERVQAGEDFAALATEYSDDPGSAPEGGLLDWSPRAAFVGPFRDALFAMTEGDIRGPVRTRFGYHVIRLEGVRKDEIKTFAEVRDEIERELRVEAAEVTLADLGAILDEAAYDFDDSLQPAAEAVALEVKTSDWMTRAGGAGIGTEAVIRAAAFSDAVLLDRRNSSAISLEDAYVYLRINDHRPSAQREFDQVRGSIEAMLKQRLAAERAASVGQEILTRLDGGAALPDLAAELDIEASTAVEVIRSDTELPRGLAQAVFAAARPDGAPTGGGVELANGGYAVYSVAAVAAGDAADPLLAERIAQAGANGELGAYVARLREDAKIVINPEGLQ